MLNDEIENSYQKVTINLVFYGENVSFTLQRDKTIEAIYRTAYDYFTPHGKIKLYYKNKELTSFLNYTIAKYFQKLKKIDILVKDSSRMDNNLDNPNVTLNELLDNNINSSSSSSFGNKNYLTQNKRAMTYCWDCKKYPINLFCRDCCAFICKYCRMDLDNSHYSHRTITLYPENLAKSANLYKSVLIEDLNEIQKVNEISDKGGRSSNEVNINIDEYKSHLTDKINRLLNKIKQIKSYQKEISYYITNKDKFKEKINQAIQDVKTISNEYNSGNNKSSVGDLKDAFSRMNNIEKSTQKICRVGKTIEEWEDINSKLEIALKTVENKIYSVITQAMGDGSPGYDNNNNYNNNNDNESPSYNKNNNDKNNYNYNNNDDDSSGYNNNNTNKNNKNNYDNNDSSQGYDDNKNSYDNNNTNKSSKTKKNEYDEEENQNQNQNNRYNYEDDEDEKKSIQLLKNILQYTEEEKILMEQKMKKNNENENEMSAEPTGGQQIKKGEDGNDEYEEVEEEVEEEEN